MGPDFSSLFPILRLNAAFLSGSGTVKSLPRIPRSAVLFGLYHPVVLCTYYCQYYRSNQGSSTHKVTSTPPLLQAAAVQNLFVKAAAAVSLVLYWPNPQLLCLQHCLFLLPVKLAVAPLLLLCTTTSSCYFSLYCKERHKLVYPSPNY